MFATLAMFVASHAAHAQGVSIDFPTSFAGFSSQDIKQTIQNIIRIILGFLGIVVIVAIIFGGFKMLTSAGDSDKMGDGRKIVTAGAIGLIIILAAYAISNFVITSLQRAV
jgi:type IV secretory pathway VirB2 component (pilin)